MYTLLKIDLHDANIHADIYDEDRYQTVVQNLSLEKVLDAAVDEFLKSNPSFRSWEDWEQRASDEAYEFEILTDEPASLFRSSIILRDSMLGGLFLARKYHAGIKRKGDNLEYIVHILEITRLLDKRGFDDEIIAAAFCHDLLEDTECSSKEIEKACGKEVLRIVEAVSNDKKLDNDADWEKKKKKYIKSVMKGGEKAIAVCIADKIVNLKSLLKAYEKDGPIIWTRFNRFKKQKLWFEKSVLEMAKQNWKNDLVKEYSTLVKAMEKLEDLNLDDFTDEQLKKYCENYADEELRVMAGLNNPKKDNKQKKVKSRSRTIKTSKAKKS